MQTNTRQDSSRGNPWHPASSSTNIVQAQDLDRIYALPHPPIPLRIATWNMRKKFSPQRIQEVLLQGKLDALLLCDVKRPRNPVTPVSYTVSRNSYSKTLFHLVQNDFVAIATTHPIDSHQATENGRTIQADITVGGRLVRLITTYVPPHSESRPANTLAADETFQDLSRLARATPNKYELIIGGDFNARPVFPDHTSDTHVGPMRIDGLLDANGQPRFGASNEHSQRLLDLLIQADLCLPDTYLRQPWRRRWTWRNPNNGKCHQLDHFLCRSSMHSTFRRISTRTDIAQKSDHRLVCAWVTLRGKPGNKSANPGGRLRRLDFGEEEATLKCYHEALRLATSQGNPLSPQAVIDAAARSFPEKQGPLTPPDSLRLAREIFYRAKHQQKRTTPSRQQVYTEARRELSKEQQRWKRTQLRAKARAIADLVSHTKGSRIPLKATYSFKIYPIIHNGMMITNDEDKSNLFASYLQRQQRTTPLPPPRPTSAAAYPTQPTPLLVKELVTAIGSLANGKAGGPDGLLAEHLKLGSHATLCWLFQCCQAWWINPQANLPHELCETTTVMIPKPKGERSCVSNYRPITLQNIRLRVLERLLLPRLEEILLPRIQNWQIGFRAGTQISEHIAAVRILTEQSLVAQSPCVAVFVDLTAAYDTVAQDKLVWCLEHHGVPRAYIDILQTIYERQSTRVRFRNAKSIPFHHHRGLPQGSSLSPLLFNIYLQTLLEEVTSKWEAHGLKGICRKRTPQGDLTWPPVIGTTNEELHINLLAYADDLVILAPTIPEAQRMLDHLVEGCDAYDLQVSIGKTEWMQIGQPEDTRQPPHLSPQGTLTIGVNLLKQAPQFRYLGIHLSHHAHDDNILKERVKAGWRAFGRHKHLLTDKRISTGLRLRLAKCLVFPCFMYGTETLTLRDAAVATIQRFEDRVFASIMQTYRSKFRDYEGNRERVKKLLQKEDQFWLVQQARLRRLMFFGHIERGTSICKDIVYSYPDTTHKGRHTTYLKEISKDIQHLKVFINKPSTPFARIAGDRGSFRKLCYKFIQHRGEKGRMKCICGKEYRSKKPYFTHMHKRCQTILFSFTEASSLRAFQAWLTQRESCTRHPPNKAELAAALQRFATSRSAAASPLGG